MSEPGSVQGSLDGRRIVVTRAREGSSSLAASLRGLGAVVLEVPTIRIEPPASYAPLDAALARLAGYDVLLVTSANTARVLVERKPGPWTTQPWTVAIGPATADALRGAGLRVDAQPEPSIAESIVRALAPTAQGKRMLLPRAAVARELLPDSLRAAGATVDVVEAYRTVPADESWSLLSELFAPGARPVDAITFTSSSTVENLFTLLGDRASEVLRGTQACSIGPITSSTLKRYGCEPAVEAGSHDVPGLAAAVVKLLTAATLGKAADASQHAK